MDSLKNCKEIDYITGYCSVCNDGYKLTSIDYNCINVENCKESLFGNCISCNYGYYLNKKEGKCIKKTDKRQNGNRIERSDQAVRRLLKMV